MLNKNTWGIKSEGQSEAALQTGIGGTKIFVSAEVKKLLYQKLFFISLNNIR